MSRRPESPHWRLTGDSRGPHHVATHVGSMYPIRRNNGNNIRLVIIRLMVWVLMSHCHTHRLRNIGGNPLSMQSLIVLLYMAHSQQSQTLGVLITLLHGATL